MNTLRIWDTEYPIMAELGDDWFLVAHPNGPAIARAGDYPYLGHLALRPDCRYVAVPNDIRWNAVDALMKWAVKQEGYPVHVRKCSECRYLQQSTFTGEFKCLAFGWSLERFAAKPITPSQCTHGAYTSRA